jgi:hypothetical protein
MMHLKSSNIGFSKKGYERTFRSRTLRPIPGTMEDIDLDDSFKTSIYFLLQTSIYHQLVREYYFFGSGPQGQLGAAQEDIVGVPTKTLVPGGGKLRIGFNHCAHISGKSILKDDLRMPSHASS